MTDFPDYYLPTVLKGWNGTEHRTLRTIDDYLAARMMGWDGETLRTLKVLESGELYATIKAVFDEALTSVQCDVDGNLTLNVKAQDLAELVSRPRYGDVGRFVYSHAVTANDSTLIGEVAGRGQIYGGALYLDAAASQRADYVRLLVDDFWLPQMTFEDMMTYGMTEEVLTPSFLLCYDEVNFIYSIGITGGITFEEYFKLYYVETQGKTPTINAHVTYALVEEGVLPG